MSNSLDAKVSEVCFVRRGMEDNSVHTHTHTYERRIKKSGVGDSNEIVMMISMVTETVIHTKVVSRGLCDEVE